MAASSCLQYRPLDGAVVGAVVADDRKLQLRVNSLIKTGRNDGFRDQVLDSLAEIVISVVAKLKRSSGRGSRRSDPLERLS